MRKNNKIVILNLMLLITLGLTGCWDSTEIQDISIVVGVGVDLDAATGEVVLNLELDSNANQDRTMGKGVVFESRGQTIYEAIRQMSDKIDKNLFWSHNQVIIVGENAARDGVAKYLDFFFRNSAMRPRALVLIAQGQAKDILNGKCGQSDFVSLGIAHIVNGHQNESSGNITDVCIQDFIENKLKENFVITLPYVAVRGQEKNVELQGMAVLDSHNWQLKEFLNSNESKGLLLLSNKIKNFVAVSPGYSADDTVTLNLSSAKAKWEFLRENGDLKLFITITSDVVFGEISGVSSLFNLSDLQFWQEQTINALLAYSYSILDKARLMNEDLLGIGEAFKKYSYSDWLLKKNTIKNLPIGIKIKPNIVFAGNVNRTVQQKKNWVDLMKEQVQGQD